MMRVHSILFLTQRHRDIRIVRFIVSVAPSVVGFRNDIFIPLNFSVPLCLCVRNKKNGSYAKKAFLASWREENETAACEVNHFSFEKVFQFSMFM